jgi:hypothetical protein
MPEEVKAVKTPKCGVFLSTSPECWITVMSAMHNRLFFVPNPHIVFTAITGIEDTYSYNIYLKVKRPHFSYM